MRYEYNFNNKKGKFALHVYNALVENFPQTFFTGGTVRDMLLKNNVSDIDIATEATPEQTVLVLRSHNINCEEQHIKFGIIIASDEEFTAEIATLRTDTYTTSRYPKVSLTTDLRADSCRRDFTINSLYFSPKTDAIIDFYNGITDIKNKVIKFIGDPQKRIEEDPLRIIRAYRFALTLQFNFDPQTEKVLRDNLHLVNTISKNNFANELKKISDTTLQQKLLQVMHKIT